MLKEKQKGGITLISLVITIVVLLILASVAISIAIDSNGIFGRARYAADTWNTSMENEKTTIENAMLIMNQIDGGTTTGGGPTLPEGWDEEKVASVVEEGTRKAPIPKGYTASQVTGEDTIENGLVIYETDKTITDADVGDEKGEEDARRKYNQYVWIPVDNINSMVMCKDHPNDNLDTETALCTTCKERTPLVGKLYPSIEYDSTEPQLTFSENSYYREPANVTDADYGDASDEGIVAIKEILEKVNYPTTYEATYESIKDDWLELLQRNFEEMAKSVVKYKGFYISRYEIQEGAASKKGADVLNAGPSSANMWYGLYTTIQNSASSESTVAQMIWGSQYDQVMMFVDEKNGYDVQIAVEDRHHLSGLEKSGQNDNDIACNIYDLEGNYYEWTAEAGDTLYRVDRGRFLRRRQFRIVPLRQLSDECQ